MLNSDDLAGFSMLYNDALARYLSKARGVKYADIRVLSKGSVEIRLHNDALEVSEHSDAIVGCRAADKSYGVSSTNRIGGQGIEIALERAIEGASMGDGSVGMAPVEPENGSYEHPVRKKVEQGMPKDSS